MNVIIEMSQTILTSEYEPYLPDGAGLSLPMPTYSENTPCIGVFVFSAHQGVAAPPRGVFFLSTDLRHVLAYEPLDECGESAKLSKLSPQEQAALVAAVNRLLPKAAAAFFGKDVSDAGRKSGAEYLTAVKKLAGESIRFYRAQFPTFFSWEENA